MRSSACRTSALAVTMVFAWCAAAAAQDYAGRERLRAQSNEFRKEVIGLIGGPDQALARGREALAAREFKWAAELADYVLVNDGANAVAKGIKAQALIELGERQINAIARNYYLSSAMYLLKGLPPQ
jgi:alkyl sulfatase BDS1-like metallo-beta-lactamase superfamily hydrolase